MKLVQHWFRLAVGPAPANTETVNIATRADVRFGAPVFRAPALPTPHQLFRELPFTENLRPRFGRDR